MLSYVHVCSCQEDTEADGLMRIARTGQLRCLETCYDALDLLHFGVSPTDLAPI